jgi:alpha-L-arabinofuranosidase
MGLLEFLEWCEDLKMQPVLAVYAGYSLQQQRVTPGPALAPYVQDALDEIEYVTGGPETRRGAERVKDGHPEPFKLTYVEVGNEDFFDNVKGSYDGRFAQFFDAIKKKYPQLQVIATTPVQGRTPDLVDDHYYRSTREMALDSNHYDAVDKDGKPKFSRTGPKIFVGEWATTQGSPTPTMEAAAGDAAWMMGMERNSDMVLISCYAPLLVNVNRNARQWGTNLIGYDALKSFGSTSYWAQRMFAENKGDTVLPATVTIAPEPSVQAPMPRGAVGLGTWSTQSEYKDLKVVGPDGTVLLQPDVTKGIGDWTKGQGQWEASDGMVRQASDNTDCRIWVGNPKWTDYTATVKARKTGGTEGFLMLFHVQDADNFLWFNVGGWTNSRTALEKAESGAKREIGKASNTTVENNRWYDLKVEVKGRSIKCYVDDKLAAEATDEPAPPAEPVYAAASKEDSTGDIILKVVNLRENPRTVKVALQGIGGVARQAQLITLSGAPTDVNTLDAPEKVAPKRMTIDDASTTFTQELPGCSVNILRFKPQ